MIHKLYYRYNLPADHDVCHLFEHLIIRRFLRAIEKSGGSRAFVGELNGTTSESSVFFDLAFFAQESVALFEEIIANTEPFDLAMIHESIAHIEAEMKSSVVIWDKTELQKQLAHCQKAFTGNQNIDTTILSKKPPIEIDHQPDDFIDITLVIEIADAREQATAAFFCMYPILLDLVRSAYFDQAPAYPSSHSEFIAYHDGNTASQTYTVKKSFEWQKVSKAAQTYLRAFDITPYTSHLNSLAEAFRNDPTYNSVPIYFYQKTASPFMKEDLAKTINTINLQTILQQVNVTISAKSRDEKSTKPVWQLP